MSVEIWQSVQRLLIYYPHGSEAIEALKPALQILQHNLPEAEILLLCRLHQLALLPIDHLDQPKGVSPYSFTQFSVPVQSCLSLTDQIKILGSYSFDAAIIFTLPFQSPYAAAYLCYLAGIPIRIGQSQEFGGGVLSSCIAPPIDPVPLAEYHLHLLEAVGLSSNYQSQPTAILNG